ncbi:TIGR03364 family FAD-dependent oxidoreductase [Pararobbsia silviterrae]|uniref:TIGR03364 family FAD-dependent oxidoreductase n=1 Tax=Pararobbsia silviterrae TaxID=1792498 RepID=UPI001F0CC8AE|nr:TIGR03364 family FAD-dependent oxidoreductase [Pararobbsia silviterrae]
MDAVKPVRETDIAIVGAGILGLSHAYAAALRGLRVTVFERTGTPTGASIRNFGQVLVTGQPPGPMLALAKASRAIWQHWASQAGFFAREAGCLLFARTDCEVAVIDEFVETRAQSGGYDVARLDQAALGALYDGRFAHHRAALHGREDMQVFSREALPAIIAYLRDRLGVEFVFDTLVRHVDDGYLDTTAGACRAAHIVVCSGHDYLTLLSDALAEIGPRVCRLQMLRVRPTREIALRHALLTGLSCLHYGAFSDLPSARALLDDVRRTAPELLDAGIHLLASPAPDGSVIIGDSHDYNSDPMPFNDERVDRHLLDLAERLFDEPLAVVQRWQGVYGSRARHERPFSVLKASRGVTGVWMHTGVGMSVGPGLGESVMAEIVEHRMRSAA